MSSFSSELEQDPFDPKEFVERIAWRATKECIDTDLPESMMLYQEFERRIKQLKDAYESHQEKCERLEMVLKEIEKRHWAKLSEFHERSKNCVTCFQELDKKFYSVAAKGLYLGDQLEGVNVPRSRAVEAQKLMKEFAQFFKEHNDNCIETLSITELFDKADIIQKLFIISQKLPKDGKFEKVKKKIEERYFLIEKELINQFFFAQETDNVRPDKPRMKEIALILSQFKGYNECMDKFIEKGQASIFLGVGIFNDIVPLCERTQITVQEVFIDPEKVMYKFVLNIYQGKLKEYIRDRLSKEKNNNEEFLNTLSEFYSKTLKLSNQLASSKIMGVELSFLNTLTRSIFDGYLNTYIRTEIETLKHKCESILNRFYESKNHQKKPIPSGSIQEFKRDLQAKIGRANIVIGNINSVDTPGETLLSEEVAINLLQETKIAFQRCRLLSNQSDLPCNALKIFDIQLRYLCSEHIDYALDIGIINIPPEPKVAPELNFFEIVRQSNAICHLLEKQIVDCLIPLVISTPKHGECIKRKRDVLETMEFKLNNGLERSISACIVWIKNILQNEQKKTDFKPETEDREMMRTPTCAKVVRFVNQCIEKVKDCFDGKNVDAILFELGTKFHRVIYEHLTQYQYTSLGAMFAICDVNEYRRCAAEFKVPLINQLFDTLHALCNLLVVAPVNLKQVCSGDQLSGLDRSILINFVQLRADYKSAKLINQFK